LDSLSDFLSFGIAPAMILHQWMLGAEGVMGLAAVMTYALCAGLRLARFTAAGAKEKGGAPARSFFTGMPTPAAAGAALIAPMLEDSTTLGYRAPAWAVVCFTLLISLLMISRIPMFSLKKVRISRPYVAPLLVGVGLLV